MHIDILAYDGCVASGVSGFCDALAVANSLAGREIFSMRLVSREGAPIRPFSGPSLSVDAPMDAPSTEGAPLTAIYVPPAFGLDAPDADLAAWVGRTHAAGAVACAACAGVFFLAEAGLLAGRAATTHWGLAATFAARYPDARLTPELMLVDGGDYVCAGGLTAYFDLALHLIARFAAPELAASCARVLLLDPGRARQTPYMTLIGPARHGDAAIIAAQEWLEDNYARPLRIRELSEAARLGERTLLRRFKKATGRTPREYAQALRVERAKRLLESGNASVEEIAAQVGHGDAPSFFRLFKGLTGLTPGEYRKRFGIVLYADNAPPAA